MKVVTIKLNCKTYMCSKCQYFIEHHKEDILSYVVLRCDLYQKRIPSNYTAGGKIRRLEECRRATKDID